MNEKKIFFFLFLLSIHFYMYKNECLLSIIINFFCQILFQFFFLLKIKTIKNKFIITLLLFLIFIISILFIGVKWIFLNLKK